MSVVPCRLVCSAVLVLLVGACGGSGGGSGDGSQAAAPQAPQAPPIDSPQPPPPRLPSWQEAPGGPPHIVVILADDLGYGSLNSYGAYRERVRTENIDRLAADGVRFTQAYAPSSVCSPTRYGVLMGRYPWRTSLKSGVVNPLDPLLPDPARQNLPRWLQAHGYVTATIGKWHLGYGTAPHSTAVTEWLDTTMPGPEALGFDYSFSVPQNHGDIFGVYFENGAVVGYDENGQLVGLRSTMTRPYGNTTYGPPFIGFDVPQRIDAKVSGQLTARATEWIREQVENGDKPFFLYFAPVAVHEPITPSFEALGSSGAGAYGDFIHDLDSSVGGILDALDNLGIAANTLVIFSSDNGGDIPARRDTPQGIALRSGLAINGALRGDKHTIWEGGTRVPLLVRMPAGHGTAAGTASDALVNLTDLFATIVELVGAGENLPEGAGPDSISFLGTLRDDGTQAGNARASTVTASLHGILAIRSGDWKWIEGVAPPGVHERPPADEARAQLYNLRDDPQEKRDLGLSRPEIAERLKEELRLIRAAQ